MNKLSVSIIRTKLFVFALAIATLASASEAFAQGTDVKVKVPFAFESGSQHFPADTYTIRFESTHVMLMQGNNDWQRKSVTSSLVFVSPDDKGRCPTVTLPVTEQDIKNVQSDIKKVIQSVWSGQIAREYCDEKDCEYCKLRIIRM